MSLTTCCNVNCYLRFNCRRYRHPAEVEELDYMTFQPHGVGRGCFWYWAVKEEPVKRKRTSPKSKKSKPPDFQKLLPTGKLSSLEEIYHWLLSHKKEFEILDEGV